MGRAFTVHKVFYPRYSRNWSLIGCRPKKCDCCSSTATRATIIENSWNPDDNERYNLCQRHLEIARQGLKKFYQHLHAHRELLKYEKEQNDNASPCPNSCIKTS